jgi:MoaA/NifB/PqqE/SkfB family radical SAM enzyme
MIIPCLAGKKLVVLRADGRIDPCEILDSLYKGKEKPWGFDDFSFGNVRESDYDMSKIVRSKKARRVKEFIEKSQCHCTFECAIFASLIFGAKNWFKVSKRFISDWYKLS